MPRTLTAKLIQLHATQRTLFLSPSKLLFLKPGGIEANSREDHAFDPFPSFSTDGRGAHTCDLIGSFNNGVTHAPSLLCFVPGEQMTAGSRGGRALPPREGSSIVTDR